MKGSLSLKVEYEGELNEALDDALEDVLKEFGYRRWASGMDMLTRVRDLAFERVVKGDSEKHD